MNKWLYTGLEWYQTACHLHVYANRDVDCVWYLYHSLSRNLATWSVYITLIMQIPYPPKKMPLKSIVPVVAESVGSISISMFQLSLEPGTVWIPEKEEQSCVQLLKNLRNVVALRAPTHTYGHFLTHVHRTCK